MNSHMYGHWFLTNKQVEECKFLPPDTKFKSKWIRTST
uniref:Uncharacterized protein n=1 Tax=Trichinella nativa TaxID=6335 RepID=A0A0V1KIP6_9BILA